MTYFFWLLGRTLQFIALIQVGFALYIGLSTADSKREITILSLGVIEFLVGLIIVRATGQRT